jgi:hypothetical protein
MLGIRLARYFRSPATMPFAAPDSPAGFLGALSGTRVLEPQNARCLWVLDLEPDLARAGSIRVFAVLRDDALATQLAGMRENRRAVALNVLAELDSGPRIGEQLCQLGLALLEWPRPPGRPTGGPRSARRQEAER